MTRIASPSYYLAPNALPGFSLTVEALECPITCVYGDNDRMFAWLMIKLSNSKSWQEFTQQPLEVKAIPGNHQYINEKIGGPLMVAYLKQLLKVEEP